MDLSNDLVSQFAKITTGDKDKNNETTVYGTVKIYDGVTCVKIDGSDLLTPVDTTTEVKEGERVTVLIKNHSAVITGNTSDPSAGVSTTDEISGNVSKVTADIGEFKELTTENFRATNAEIENLNTKNAQIENLVATKASIEELEAVQAKIKDLDVEFINAEMANINDALIQKADIKDLDATNANIKDLQADTARIDEALITKADVTMLDSTWADIDSLEADIAEIDTALIGKASVEDLNAVRAEISDLNVTELEATVADINVALITKANVSDLEASQADIEKLQADTARIDEALITKADVTDLNAVNAKIDNLDVASLRASVANVENALIDKADVEDLNATNATIDDLTARVGVINDAMIGKASIEELQAVEAQIEDLDVEQLRADVARIDEAVVNKANIADLNAANADIDILNTQVADINTLVNGNLTSDNIATLHLTSANTTVDNAFIKDAMIDSVTANKIMSGSIDTNKVTIKSTDGSMTLTGSVQQFKDENGKVRIQIGKDSGGNFSFVLYDSTGNGVLIDEDGIKSSNAIADGLIVDSKVANNANISGSKLNIASVISAVNNDSSTTIKSNKIFLDEQNQSLEVAFNSLKTQVETIQDVTIDGDLTSVIEQVQSNTTQINVNKGNISTLTSENTLRKEEIKDLDDDIKSVSTSMNNKYTSLQQDLSGFKTTVGETYTTKTEFNSLTVGGRNLVTGTKDYRGWTALNGNATLSGEYNGFTVQEQTADWSYYRVPFDNTKMKIGECYTLSVYLKCDVKSPTVYLTFCGAASYSGAFPNLFTTNVTSEWQRFSTTITIHDDMLLNKTNYGFRIEGSGFDTTGMKLYVAGIKFEKGNKATDWTPAPEDVQNDIDEVNNNLTTNYSTTSAMNSAITQKANEITNTVSQTYTTKTEFGNLNVGGRNYISNSAFINGSTDWNIQGNTIDTTRTFNGHPTLKSAQSGNTADVWSGCMNYNLPTSYSGDFKAGETYTISCWYYVEDSSTFDKRLALELKGKQIDGTNEMSFGNVVVSLSNLVQGVWTKLSKTITLSYDVRDCCVRAWVEQNGIAWFADFKMEKGNKATDWTPAPEDVQGEIDEVANNLTKNYSTTAQMNSAITQKANEITNTVSQTYATKSEVDSKIYDVESKIQQTADAWTATFASSGGYNLIRNSTGSNLSTRQWTTSSSNITLTAATNDSPTGSPNRYYLHLKNETTSERYAYSTRFSLKPNTTYRFTGYFHNYTACKAFDVYILGSSTLAETDGSFNYDQNHIYRIIDYQNTNGAWKKFSVTFTTNSGIRTGFLRIDHNGYNSSGTNTPSLHWSAISLTQGEAEVPWSPHPDEVYSGITTIDATGVRVEQTGYSGYTKMSADGFYVNDGSTDAVKITKDGAVFTGKMVVQSGSTIPTTTLTGKVTSSQLDSAVTTDISTAKTNASTALSTANTAKSTADSVKSTVDASKTNWDNAYSRVNEWAYGAVTGSTTIDGGLIQANTILANKIALCDFTNYSQLNEMSASNLGFTVSREADGVWYSYGPTRDKFMSEFHSYAGFETLRIQYDISTTCKAYANSNATSATYVGTAIGIYCYDGTKNPIDTRYATRVTATSSGNATPVTSAITLPSGTRYFRVFIQTEAVSNFSGTIKVKNVLVTRMNSGELIVDGAITANKISSNSVTADKISAGAITTDKLGANAVTAAKIASSAITADKISSGSITSDKVATGAITAKHVIIADSSNILIASPSENPYNSSVYELSDGSKYFKFGSDTTLNYYPCDMARLGKNVSVKTTDKFRLIFRGYATVAVTIKFIWRLTYTDNTFRDIIQYRIPITTSSTMYELEVPANYQEPYYAKTVKGSDIFFEFPNTTLGYAYVKDASLVRKSAGDLIVDGSITAGKITSNAVTTDKLNANAVTAAKIASSAITADKISAGAITADKIASDAVTTDKLNANAVTAAKIASSAITADKIASNAVTAAKIAAGSITTSKLAVKDGTNYAQLTDQTASQWGWTKQDNSSDPYNCWYQKNSVARDNQISEYYPCKGGESLRVKADIFTSVYGQSQQNGTATATARPVSIMIVTQNTNDGRSYIAATYITAASTSGTTNSISSVITLPAEARRFAVYVQVDGHPTFSGTLRVRNVIVNKMSSGELIVDGSITANKIAAGAITADMINGGTLSAADEINFVGGARIFGTGGESGAKLTISASEYNLSGASQGFLGGSWSINNNLTVTGTSTLTGAVTTGGNLTVAGTAKSKTLNVTSTSTLSGGVTCGSTLTANGITSSTTLNVTGASTLTGSVSTGSELKVAGVLTLNNYSIYLGTIYQSVTAPAIKFGTDSYIAAHSGIHIINTSGNAQTLRAGTIYSNGSTVTSDRRKKMDIRYVNVDKQSIGESGRMAPNTNITIQDMHEFIGSLPLTSFRYTEEVKSNRNLTHYGFLTQDIMYSKVGSELVAMLDEDKRIGDEEDYTGYSVEKLLMFVCGALQEEIHQRQLLEKEIKNLKEGK